tara:strand:+ start:1047 stop:1418 length:372 start_codon:yes stop_codon:yes gene_type:complete
MLVQLSFPSRSNKTIRKAVYEFGDRISLKQAIRCLKSTDANRANLPTTNFEIIPFHNGQIYRWDSNSKKFINQRKQEEIAQKLAETHQNWRYEAEEFCVESLINRFFDPIIDDFRILHKPMTV